MTNPINLMMISKHTGETCPGFSAKWKKIYLNYFEKAEALSKKHGIKTVGMWTDHPMHTAYILFEAPSFEAFMAFSMEPDVEAILGGTCARVFPVLTGEQVYTMIKQAKV
jgi:hypothetical protein